MTSYEVRHAAATDAAAAVELLCASITELCVKDHQNDPATLGKWLENKTVPNLERWVSDPENRVVVADAGGRLLGIGLVRSTGDIHLCYVRPGQVRSGIGRAIVQRLEAEARSWGLRQLQLASTCDARAFYEHLGYVPEGEPVLAFGVLQSYPYRKRL